MILTLTGTHQQPFNRLLQAVEALPLDEEKIYQTGHSPYKPAGQCHAFLPYDETVQLIARARVVVCHAGTGTVMSVLKAGKCPVVAPRLARFGEHVDDHQLELLAALEGLIVPYLPGEELLEKVEAAVKVTAGRAVGPAERLIQHLHQLIGQSVAAHK